MRIQKIIWLAGLAALLTTACKREEPQPGPTIIQGATKDEQGNAIPRITVWITGNKGSYFTGTRQDTTFAKLVTDSKGLINFEQYIPSEWRVNFVPIGFPDYDIVRIEGVVTDKMVVLGKVNTVTAILRKR